MNDAYQAQVRLMLDLLPLVAEEVGMRHDRQLDERLKRLLNSIGAGKLSDGP